MMAGGALEGIRVIELGQMVSAPYCAKLFADFGADVIKVEPPEGDLARRWGPFPKDEPHPEKSGLFFFLNTNKRGVTLDMSTPIGRDMLLDLLRQTDVFIENNPPRQMREWGLDYHSISRVNPHLVMISITPYGQTGPYSEWNGYDLNGYHLSATGHRYLGHPDKEPLEPGTFAADFFGAVAAAAWGLAAVQGREAAGGGQHIDVSCAEVTGALFVGAENIGGYAQDGVFERRGGLGMGLAAPCAILPCKDGYVWMIALEPHQWKGLAKAMGDPEWMQNEMFLDLYTRGQLADAIYPLVQQWNMERTKWEIMELCQANGNPTTAVFTVAEAAEHPHIREREYVVEVEHAALGRVRDIGAPFKLPESPGGPVRGAPLLGQHNAEVLGRPAGAPRLARGRKRGQANTDALPLEGIRVANFGWGWTGPVVGQTLAFLGAEVYKVESRVRIDINRTILPFAGGVRDPDRSLQNHCTHAGNGSVTLNLTKPEAQELARQLVAKCDVVVENFGRGVMEDFHLSYEELQAVKPDIVMISLSSAGLYGPLKDIRTYGMTASSITGFDSLNGYLGGPPVPFENAFPDPYNGVLGAFAVLVGLSYRNRTGKGQHIDFSQQESMMQMVGPAFMDYFLNGRVGGPIGNRHPLGAGAPHGVFPCAGEDRWVSIAVMNQEEWQGLVKAMGSPDWAQALEFADMTQRVENMDALHERLVDWTRGFNDYDLAHHLQRYGVAAAPVLNVADLLHDPHYRARGTFIEVEHPLGFRETIYGAYVKASRTKPRIRPGPVIGQDNDYVFKQLLNLSEHRYRQAIEEHIIY